MLGEAEVFQRQNLIRELNRGGQFARQLLNLLDSPVDDDGGLESQRVLVKGIVRSFDAAIVMVRSEAGGRKMADNRNGGCGGSDLARVESSTGEKEHTSQGRGGNKKRKHEQTATATTTIPAVHADDGYAWRKYGQKEILGARHPRNYFRCTHKHDKGCSALKQVQKLDQDPSLVQVTYMGSHTCKKHTPAISEIDGADKCENEGFFLNFETDSMPYNFSFSSFPFLKQKENEEMAEPIPTPTSTPSQQTGCGSSLDFNVEGPFDLLKQLNQVGSDDSDGVCSLPELDMGLVNFVEFEDLDQCGFLCS